jgi:DNA-binding transcriptional MerR regulator
MEWSIQEVARVAGTTSRTLRHYGNIGLLPATRTGGNGYRYYDAAALARLQHILLLRQLGVGLPEIAGVLAGDQSDTAALAEHLGWLRHEHDRLARQIRSVERTIDHLENHTEMKHTGGGEQLMAEDMFDGFDHTQYKDEVERRWGADAYTTGDAWWRGKSDAERQQWKAEQRALADDWIAAATSGVAPDSAGAQALAGRHYAWLATVPGTPRGRRADGVEGPTKEYFVGLGEMYVDDERFAANYGGAEGARFVRDAMRFYADATL